MLSLCFFLWTHLSFVRLQITEQPNSVVVIIAANGQHLLSVCLALCQTPQTYYLIESSHCDWELRKVSNDPQQGRGRASAPRGSSVRSGSLTWLVAPYHPLSKQWRIPEQTGQGVHSSQWPSEAPPISKDSQKSDVNLRNDSSFGLERKPREGRMTDLLLLSTPKSQNHHEAA